MLNLKVAMKITFLLLSFVTSLIYPRSIIRAQESTQTPGDQVIIMSPSPGQALQGTVLITGEIEVEEPSSVELSFAYFNDQRDTWFVINESEDAIPGKFNIEWDTTTITDGEYTLRLLVSSDQGQSTDYVAGLRVRNYSAIETDTPMPTSTPAPVNTLAPSAPPTLTSSPKPLTATPLPPNPAQIDSTDIGMSIAKGGLVVIGIFGLLGIYQYIRSRRRNNE
jgi:hypothetical protein